MADLSADPAADRVARRALAASAALHDELLAAVRRRLRRLAVTAPASDVLDAARHALDEFTGSLAALLSDATLAAWLVGAGGVASLLPAAGAGAGPPRPPFSLPPAGESPDFDWDGSPAWLPLVRRAVEELRSRELVTSDRWDALSAGARARAFTAAGLATEDAVGKVRDALADAVESGGGLPDFRRAAKDAVGETGLSLERAESIFRTESARAYADGLDGMLAEPVVRDVLPFVETVPVTDSRLSELCEITSRSGIEGTGIFLRADPTWRLYRNPRHPNCRCATIPLTVEMAAARGLRYAREWLRLGRQPLPPAYVPLPPVPLPRGWRAA